MKEKLKNGNQGITLIALIITIIVMLILVVTAVSVTINSGLFAKAGEATREWKANEEAEQELANGQVTINNKAYNNIDEYVEESKTKKITFYILTTNAEWESEVLEYTVAEGTTWETFFSQNQIPGPNGYLDIEVGNTGSYLVMGGARIFESTGSYSEGPFVYPTTLIKEGITYDCQV